MAWSLAVLVAVVAAAWILILAVARSSTAPCILGSNGDVRIRRSSSRRRRSLPASVEDVDISDDLISGSDLQDRLRGQLGWFWLAVSYHFSTSEKSRGNNPNYFKNRSRKSMSLLLSKYVNVYYTLGTLCVLAFFFGIPVYLILEVHRNLSSSGSLPKSGTDLDSDIISPSGLMIPGLTVPLRDWLSLFLASFMAIAWHEAGHAIVAILYVNSLFTFNAFQLGNEFVL